MPHLGVPSDRCARASRAPVARGAFVALAAVALGIVACVDIPDNMRAQFAPAGPNDRTNYVPNRHGTAPPNTPAPMLPWDAGVVATPPDASPATPVTAPDGGNA